MDNQLKEFRITEKFNLLSKESQINTGSNLKGPRDWSCRASTSFWMKNTAGLLAIPEKDGSDLSRRHYPLIISLEKNSTTLFSIFWPVLSPPLPYGKFR